MNIFLISISFLLSSGNMNFVKFLIKNGAENIANTTNAKTQLLWAAEFGICLISYINEMSKVLIIHHIFRIRERGSKSH